MPANGSDRDREPGSQSRSHEEPNLFIRFKNNVDSHISAVLQGILGLPSAFSRNEDDGNGPRRWKDLDEELKRRDELQARQRALREAAASASRAATGQDDQEVSIPVKTYRGFPGSSSPTNDREENPADDVASIDLYSSFTPSLLERLALPKELAEENLWHQKIPTNISHLPFQTILTRLNLRDDQSQEAHNNPLAMMQFMTYNLLRDFSTSTSNFSVISLLSRFSDDARTDTTSQTRSLLPYLLFSPYSPLALTHLPPLPSAISRRRRGTIDAGPVDEFTYCDAFEDLIKVSQGRPMQLWDPKSIRALSMASDMLGRDIYPLPRLVTRNNGARNGQTSLVTAQLGVYWIRDSLGLTGLLTESPPDFLFPFVRTFEDPGSLLGRAFGRFFKSWPDEAAGGNPSRQEPDTELDLSERLRELGDVLPIDENSSELLSQVAARRRDQKSNRENAQDELMTRLPYGSTDLAVLRRKLSTISSSTQTDFPSPSSTQSNKTVSVVRKQHTPPTPTTEDDGEMNSESPWLVSTITTTERSVDKDGQVTSTVQIEKTFSDGSREVSRVVDSRHGGENGKNESAGLNTENNAGIGENKSDKETKEKGKKKGWFWGK